MIELITLAEAKAHLRIDTDDDDNDVTLKIQAASAAVMGYLKSAMPYEPELDTAGDPVLDSAGDPIPYIDSAGDYVTLPQVKAAVMILLGILYRDRDGQESNEWQLGYLPMPVQSLLYPLRSPALC